MFLLGYDIGSSSVKASLVDAGTGKCVASAFFPKTEAGIIAVRSGWAEQEPEDWWENLKLSTVRPFRIGDSCRRHQGHRHLLSDARPGMCRQTAARAAPGYNLVRFACGPLWTKGVRNDRRGVLPCALA